MKKNVQSLKSKGRKVEMLYSESDLYNCFEHMESVEVNKRIKLDENCEILLQNNSHVLGSCNATIYIRKPNSNRWKVICYSSDMGSAINKKYSDYLKEQNIPTKCNLFISEGTYSDKTRTMDEKLIEKERKEFIKIIKDGLNNGSQILLPTFAFSRSQQILTTLFRELKDEKWFNESEMYVVTDGTLMNNIHKCYSRILEGDDKKLFDSVMEWNKLKKIDSFDGTMALLSKREPRIILASSGFLENGKISIYLPQILGCSKDIIILTGYCSQNNEGSIGWKLVTSTQKTITFNGDKNQTVLKRAKIYQQKSWSSHITNQELKDLFVSLSCDKIIVHHCDENNKNEFIKDCNEYLRSKNKTTKIIATSKCCNQFVL
ncbi:MBL fold metallo-hydrolase [Clostridium butyricum]|uniref:MBL fold metallo-hydrolase n=1 Tax=Clostridium butyricum TaxID=1492 RepID=UPI00325A8252